MYLLEQAFVVAIVLIIAVFGAAELGYRVGMRSSAASDERSHVGVLQGAMLGLLGLLLSFAFSGATVRFMERQDGIVHEANAISTAYARSDLLDDANRDALKASLRAYARDRLSLFREVRAREAGLLSQQLRQQEQHLWSVALAGVRARPEVTMAVLPTINDIMDRHSMRDALATRHLPAIVVAALMLAAVITMGTVGYASGLIKRRPRAMLIALTALIVLVLWITMDMDNPRVGLIRISPQPLIDVQQALAN